MKTYKARLTALGLLLLASLTSPVALAKADEPIKRNFCVFDVIGANGDVFNLFKDYVLQARAEGIELKMQPYTDENVAVADFVAGQCDMVAVTDLRARRFNRFTGSISAIGAVPTYEDLRLLLQALARPRAARYLTSGEFDIMGIVPAGAGYMFVNDRKMNAVEAYAGKRVTVLSYQRDAMHMINYINATPIPSDITTFGGKFNNGAADACYAPAAAYRVLELYKGVGDNGGIVRYPLGQLTWQIVARRGTFEEGFVERSREIAYSLLPAAMAMIRQYEESVPAEHWIDISRDSIEGYQEMFRANRLQLASSEQAGGRSASTVYDDDMMRIMRKIRCHTNPGAAECAASDRE